jgi:hypothetical protein
MWLLFFLSVFHCVFTLNLALIFLQIKYTPHRFIRSDVRNSNKRGFISKKKQKTARDIIIIINVSIILYPLYYNLGGTVAEWHARPTADPRVLGSNPGQARIFSCDLWVPLSTPSSEWVLDLSWGN